MKKADMLLMLAGGALLVAWLRSAAADKWIRAGIAKELR